MSASRGHRHPDLLLRSPLAPVAERLDRGERSRNSLHRAAGRGRRGNSVESEGDSYGNAVAENFFATIRREVIDARSWPTRAGTAQAKQPIVMRGAVAGTVQLNRYMKDLGQRSSGTSTTSSEGSNVRS